MDNTPEERARYDAWFREWQREKMARAEARGDERTIERLLRSAQDRARRRYYTREEIGDASLHD